MLLQIHRSIGNCLNFYVPSALTLTERQQTPSVFPGRLLQLRPACDSALWLSITAHLIHHSLLRKKKFFDLLQSVIFEWFYRWFDLARHRLDRNWTPD